MRSICAAWEWGGGVASAGSEATSVRLRWEETERMMGCGASQQSGAFEEADAPRMASSSACEISARVSAARSNWARWLKSDSAKLEGFRFWAEGERLRWRLREVLLEAGERSEESSGWEEGRKSR